MKIKATFEKNQVENLKKILIAGKINKSALCKLAGAETVKALTVSDWLRGKGLLKEPQFLALKKAINTIRIEIKAIVTEFDKNPKSEEGIALLKKMLTLKVLFWFVVFNRDVELHRKIDGWELNRRGFPLEEVDKIKSYFLIFLTETVI